MVGLGGPNPCRGRGTLNIPKKGEESDAIKMDTKRLASTFAILMLALGIAGFAYANWSSTINIEGEVTTGYIELEWSFDYKLIQEKPVAYAEYKIEDGLLWFGLYNVYPCLEVELRIDVHNKGTIPAKLYNWNFGLEEGSTDLRPWIKIIDSNFYGEDGNQDGTVGSIGQLDPCDSVVLYVKLHFVQEDEQGNKMPQNAQMYFWARLEWVNWNAEIED